MTTPTVSLQAGAARVTMTGTGQYGLGGPGRRRAAGVHDDLFARCFTLSDGILTVAFLTLDVRGVPAAWVGQLRSEVRRRISTRQLHILVAGTAVASGPDLLGEGRGCGGPYHRYLLEQAAEVVVTALQALEPARLCVAVADMPPDLLVDHAAQSPAPILVWSAVAEGARPIATLAVLGCRPDVLGPRNREVSADFLVAYHTAIEAARGGLSLALPGAVGDQTAREAGAAAAARSFEAAHAVGEALATPVLIALAAATLGDSARLEVDVCHADLPPAATWRGRWARFRSLLGGGRGLVRAELHAVRIDGSQLLTVPGAPTAAAVAQVRARMGLEAGAVAGCVDGMWGLLAPPESPPVATADGWPQILSPAGWPVIRDTLPVL